MNNYQFVYNDWNNFRQSADESIFYDKLIYALAIFSGYGNRSSNWRKLRESLWQRDFYGSKTGKCFVCRCLIYHDRNSHDSLNRYCLTQPYIPWEASHVISRYYGGEDKLDNLEVCCRDCNRSMGVCHMDVYKSFYITVTKIIKQTIKNRLLEIITQTNF